jgi:protein transport protein SEC13
MATTSTVTQGMISGAHDDMIHDAVLDYYGRRLATCSSDRTVKIYEVEGDTNRPLETLKGHDSAVWSVSWAHPKFGSILASAGYDGRVIIWKEHSGIWQKVYDYSLHKASVNSTAWAPHETGCVLACASSDGQVSVLDFKDNALDPRIFSAHHLGVTSISWAPHASPGPISNGATGIANSVRRFVTGGCDNALRLWTYDSTTLAYRPDGDILLGHSDWVRDVSWSPTVLQKSYIASASQDSSVRIWTSGTTSPGHWHSHVIQFQAPVWRVSWSLSGNVLAVSGGDNVTLWKETLRGDWECIQTIDD